MLRRSGDLLRVGCFCSNENQNQACTEAENRALEGRSGVLPLSFSSGWPAQRKNHGSDHGP